MNKNKVWEKAEDGVLGQSGSRWIATFTSSPPADLPRYIGRALGGNGRSRTLYLGSEVDGALPFCAEHAETSVIFQGLLFNQQDLRDELGDFLAPAVKHEADLILAGYLRWGEDLLPRLRGSFALLIWDRSREILLCVRDPMGSHPLFYAEGRNELLLSASIEVLLRHPNVSRALNRPALVDHFLDRYPRLDETCYEAVSRVPPGHVLRVAREGHRVFRYWDPAPNGEVEWLRPEEVERFDEVLDRAVSRLLNLGPACVFLSGGFDSVSVAAVATDLSRMESRSKPWALSLVFPDPVSNEEIVQRGVATQLGLRQVVKPFFEALGSGGLLEPALELTKSLSAPLMNTWLPAYFDLAREGQRRGCQTILTGGGGDEWLTITPALSADLLRDFDLLSVYRLWQSMRRSYRRSSLALLRTALWTFGAKPLVLPPVHRFVKQVAPWALKLRHRVAPGHWIPPKWLAPDQSLRLEFDRRRDEEHARKPTTRSNYFRDVRPALDHAVVSWEAEEIFEVYQRLGMRMLAPYMDADLIELLYRTPPFLLLHNGRNKGLVRASLSRRFPDLGFDRHRKLEATNFYASLIYRDGNEAWQKMGNPHTLADLGIIDDGEMRPVVERLLAKRQVGQNAHRVWTVLNLETWARAHV